MAEEYRKSKAILTAATNVCPWALGQSKRKAREVGTSGLSLRKGCAHNSRWRRKARKLGHRGRLGGRHHVGPLVSSAGQDGAEKQ